MDQASLVDIIRGLLGGNGGNPGMRSADYRPQLAGGEAATGLGLSGYSDHGAGYGDSPLAQLLSAMGGRTIHGHGRYVRRPTVPVAPAPVPIADPAPTAPVDTAPAPTLPAENTAASDINTAANTPNTANTINLEPNTGASGVTSPLNPNPAQIATLPSGTLNDLSSDNNDWHWRDQPATPPPVTPQPPAPRPPTPPAPPPKPPAPQTSPLHDALAAYLQTVPAASRAAFKTAYTGGMSIPDWASNPANSGKIASLAGQYPDIASSIQKGVTAYMPKAPSLPATKPVTKPSTGLSNTAQLIK